MSWDGVRGSLSYLGSVDSGSRITSEDMSLQHFVWTFQVIGGQSFQLSVPQNPSFDHDGRMTLWKLVGSKALADEVEVRLAEFGGQVKRFTEEQTPELLEWRGKLPVGD